jgi:hypothetical protein
MRKQTLNPIPQGTIDLHGYNKSKAIRMLTMFMEQQASNRKSTNSNQVWVLVITGSGAHSNEGPVLRTAIEAVFRKRQMKYIVNNGKGSFTVDVLSGFKLFEPGQPVDTKVLVCKEERKSYLSLSSLTQNFRALPPPSSAAVFDPLPSEVAATDAFIEESRKEGERAKGREEKETHQLQKAVSISLMNEQRQNEEQVKDEEMLQHAMSLSMVESLPPIRDDDDEYQKILQLSRHEFEKEQASDPLQLALDLSEKEACQEDEELNYFLEKSKICF